MNKIGSILFAYLQQPEYGAFGGKKFGKGNLYSEKTCPIATLSTIYHP
jgi:hypothetical protein